MQCRSMISQSKGPLHAAMQFSLLNDIIVVDVFHKLSVHDGSQSCVQALSYCRHRPPDQLMLLNFVPKDIGWSYKFPHSFCWHSLLYCTCDIHS